MSRLRFEFTKTKCPNCSEHLRIPKGEVKGLPDYHCVHCYSSYNAVTGKTALLKVESPLRGMKYNADLRSV